MRTVSKKLRITSIVPILGIPLLIASACSSDPPGPVTWTGGTTGTGTGGTTGGTAPNTGGTAPNTGGTSPSTGGTAPSTGGIGQGTGGTSTGGTSTTGGIGTNTGGTGPGTGGTSTGGSTNGGSGGSNTGGTDGGKTGNTGGTTGGSGGKAGNTGGTTGGNATTGGSGGGGTDLMDVAKALDGKMLVGPCLTDSAVNVCQTVSGGCPDQNNSDIPLRGVLTTDTDKSGKIVLGGDPNTTYTINLHVQGEVEAKRYTGGQDAESSLTSPKMNGWCKGGTPDTGNAYNVYMIRVTPPGGTKQDYFLNAVSPPGVSDHTTYGIDYNASFQAKGGSAIRLVAADSNCSMIKNCGPTAGNNCAAPIVLQNMDPKAVSLNPNFNFTKAYNGQWIVLVVTSVTSP
jgi:hypothetical protein